MKVILRTNSQTNIIEDIGESYITIPTGYIEVNPTSYPNDLMCGCYRYVNNKFVKDEKLYSEFLTKQELAEHEV